MYSESEERINILTHAIGIVLSLLAIVLLSLRAFEINELFYYISFGIFGLSLLILYTASTVYHRAKDTLIRNKLRIFDHAAIYILIAGTYTPFTLITLQGMTAWVIFSVSWAMAITGIILKIFYTGKYELISTLMYVFMGWLILFAIKPLIDALHPDGLIWLVSGGLSYTIGAIIYGFDSLKYNHAIFHLFVLIGSFCHFITVYKYV